MTISLDDLRRFAVGRNFPKPTTLKRALHRIGFVQADPIRAPARAQDLILRHRVENYHAGDLERRYSSLDIEEDFFVNYGFVTRTVHGLMHPRSDSRVPADDIDSPWSAAQEKSAKLVLEFVRGRGIVHPREVDEYFAHGKVKNYWGGSSNATTHLLDAMHYRGFLRVVRREKGIRVYAAKEPWQSQIRESGREPEGIGVAERCQRIDALVDLAVRIYAPLPAPSLAYYVRRLRYAAPQWRQELPEALRRAKERLAGARLEGCDWYWPKDESPKKQAIGDKVRLLAPFDPLVHDRTRFELLWNWSYRFEAYTPAVKRKMGYYAMPLLWRDQVIGWGNLSTPAGQLEADFGYIASRPPRALSFKRALEEELERLRLFLSSST